MNVIDEEDRAISWPGRMGFSWFGGFSTGPASSPKHVLLLTYIHQNNHHSQRKTTVTDLYVH